jgi:hypothetical protein
MTITDCWRAYKHAMPVKRDDITIKDFADRIAFDCINNEHSDIYAINGYLATPEDTVIAVSVEGENDDVSTVTAPTTNTSVMEEHAFVKNHELEYYTVQGEQKSRPKRRVCRAPGCSIERHWRCSNPRCESFQYTCGSGMKSGVFYCPQHFGIHFQNVLNDTSGGF